MTKNGDEVEKNGKPDKESQPDTEIRNLKVDISKGQSWTRFLSIEVPSEKVDEKFREVYDNFRNKAKVPGFRPGKVPMNIIEKKYDSDVRAEVLEALVDEAYKQAIIQKNVWPLANPVVSEVNFEKNQPLKFKAEIEIRPEIKLKKYKGFRVEKIVRKVAEKDVGDSIEYMREKMAEFETVERASMNGDQVKFDLLKKSDKLGRMKDDKLEDVEIVLGSEGILKEFQDGLIGMSIGEMKDIGVKYPENYHDKNLAGDEILYTAVVKEVKKRNLPEVDNELVSKVTSHKTVDEFRESLKQNLEKQAENEATRNLRSELIKRVVQANSFDVPISLLDRYLNSVVEEHKSSGENVDENAVRNQYRAMGENLIRWNFLYYEIAKAEEITVSAEDRKKWVHDFAVTHNLTEDRAREALGQSRRLNEIDDSIIEGKVLEFIMKNSEIITNEK
jgi:trigger factor